MWTLVKVRAANEAAGWDFFGREERTLSPMDHFALYEEDGEWWIERIKGKPSSEYHIRHRRLQGKAPRGNKQGVGDRRRFEPDTGYISSVVKSDAQPNAVPVATRMLTR